MLAILSGIISTRVGRYLLASIVLSALAFGAWWHFSAVYEARGRAAQRAADAAHVARLQRSINASAAALQTQADRLAKSQINQVSLLSEFQNALPAHACPLTPDLVRSLGANWAKG